MVHTGEHGTDSADASVVQSQANRQAREEFGLS
jgi:hypothetical protein